MRRLEVFRNGARAGILTEEDRHHYVFRYDDIYFADSHYAPISLTLPKTQQEYRSDSLFPFFFNMLSEGVNRNLQCTQLRIDPEDHFGLLMVIGKTDTVGAVTLSEMLL